MTKDLQTALENTETTYRQLVEIANDTLKDYTEDINSLIKEATDNIENLSTEQIRHLILELSLKAYAFGDLKEKSALKAECAETLRKEAYAREYTALTEGAVATKENLATTRISNEVLVEAIYNLMSNLCKTKLDELHRCVDSLKSVLVSRAAEAKMMASFSDNDKGEIN